MIRLVNWLDRTWSFDLPVGVFPALIERLRGGPARAEELVVGVPDSILRTRPGDSWSVNEHLGHLDDMHELDVKRLAELLAHAEVLTAADMTNHRTDAAGHSATPVREILHRFRHHRRALVLSLEELEEDALGSASLHPRLQRPMRLIDWVQFVVDHDDHHLVRAREALRAVGRNAA